MVMVSKIRKEKTMADQADIFAVFETNKGLIRVKLFADKAPVTVGNFVNLARRKFYDGIAFHRVIEEFMIQGGCPQGDGRGGPGYRFEDEFVGELRHNRPGILSMANAGPGTNGSQFFITHVPTPWLDDHHTIFGEVVSKEDQEVVKGIAQGDVIVTVTIEGDILDMMRTVQSRVDEWNEILNEKFQHLTQVPPV